MMSVQPYQFALEHSSNEENAEEQRDPEEQENNSLKPNGENEQVSRQENLPWCMCELCPGDAI